MHRAAPLLALAFFVGCGDDVQPQQASPPSAPPRTVAEEAPTPKAETPYVYNHVGKRDPFRPFLSELRDPESEQRTVLQRFDIEQYTLVGIIWNTEDPHALVEDPTGEGHIMKIGSYVGKNWGKVTQIQPDRVTVTEEYQSLDGDLHVTAVYMQLPGFYGADG